MKNVVGKIIRGMIAHLSRDLFTVQVFFISPTDDEFSQFIRQHADYVEDLPLDLNLARQQIAKQQLDILFYPETSMDSFTYFLAFARLAPVQCTTWGHPVTTGIRNMDYFLSAHAMEVAEAQEHYSEQLVCLNSLPIFFYRPKLPMIVKTRADFGLTYQHPLLGTKYQRHLYLCPQSLFKFHPEFDFLLEAILRQDPAGQVVLSEGGCQHFTKLLQNRFARTIPEVLERILFLPKLGYLDYLQLLALADVMLDTIHFGGGVTSYDALAFGIPVVTFPAQFMRGRATYYCYQKMGMLECVADSPQQYVEIALRLGTDSTYREQVKAKILASNQVLYEDFEAVRELEQFLVAAVGKVR